ncbi:hypothetical protein BACCAP_01012 [Pseudoflavonifractor capillosus ATCC 29799]|uniref:Uncharacterized protein n=1 Tax=Pseudoflavonifractor capillosus ATCC 29799 TaxID=411467 RepID=A6NS34_9FIRM|nr:hypothetical protein BACCAP_01012 [Pseudoflavonifractor capillosus ATCC 29799]
MFQDFRLFLHNFTRDPKGPFTPPSPQYTRKTGHGFIVCI